MDSMQGMSTAGLEVMVDPTKMIRLWAHEVSNIPLLSCLSPVAAWCPPAA